VLSGWRRAAIRSAMPFTIEEKTSEGGMSTAPTDMETTRRIPRRTAPPSIQRLFRRTYPR